MDISVLNNENNRLTDLLSYHILDTPAEDEYNNIVSLASKLCSAPIAVISFVDETRQWFKAQKGINFSQTNRDENLGEQSVTENETHIVTDTLKYSQPSESVWASGEYNIRSYASVPIVSENGYVIGRLFVSDTTVREFTTIQIEGLKQLSTLISALLAFRKKRNAKLNANQNMLATSYINNLSDVVFIIDPAKNIIGFNRIAAQYILSDTGKEVKEGDSVYSYIDSHLTESFNNHFAQVMQGAKVNDYIQVFTPKNDRWWSVQYAPIQDNKKIIAVSLTISDITESKKTERQYEEISNVSKVGGWEMDLVNDILKWSDITKQSHEVDLDFKPTLEIALNFYKPGRSRDRIKKAIDEAITTGKPFDEEVELITQKGKHLWVRTKGQAEFHKDKITRLFGTFQDVTEKRNIYEELLISQQYYKSLFEQNPDAVFALDLNEKFISVNEGVAKLAESTVEEMINKGFAQFCPVEDAAMVMHNFNEAQLGKATSYDCGFVTANGHKKQINITNLPVIINGVVVAIYGIAKDISESIEAKNQLLKSAANLRTVFDNTEIGYILLTNDFKIVSFNKPAQDYTRRKLQKPLVESENLVGMYETDRMAALDAIKVRVLVGEKVEYERNIKLHENEDYWYNIIFHPVSGENNEVLGVIMEIENITSRKKSEIELEKSFNLLNEQNKRLLNFSYIISHNLRSHTSNIKSILTFLEEAENDEEKAEMLQHLKNVSGSLDETIHNLNDVVSINNSVNLIYKPLFLIEFISKATDVLKEQIIQKKAIIQNKLLIDTSVNFNPAFLESITLNFLSNAIKYSHPDRQPIITLDSYLHNGQFVLTISDNGIGIDMEKNGDKLFGFYKTFNGNSDARGLGLFICKNQVEYMGGKIEVESTLGVGTTFKIFFK